MRPDDSGIYTCRAVNDVGEAITTCTMKVEGTAFHYIFPRKSVVIYTIPLNTHKNISDNIKYVNIFVKNVNSKFSSRKIGF